MGRDKRDLRIRELEKYLEQLAERTPHAWLKAEIQQLLETDDDTDTRV